MATRNKKLQRAMGRAIADFSLIEEGDRILCAVSGGKDSFVMHALLADLARRAPVRFEILALNVDQGHPGYPVDVLPRYMAEGGHELVVVEEDTFAIVKDKVPAGKTTCSLCSRLRRGILYTQARALGCNKIALGHHRDDAITTLMLNMLFSGQLKAMPAKLVCDAGDVVVIRPLIYCAEQDIAEYAAEQRFPIIPCNLCGSQPNQQRRIVSDMLAELDRRYPNVRSSMLAALGDVRPSHLLDARLHGELGALARDDESADDAAVAPALVRLRRAADEQVAEELGDGG